MVKSRQNVNKIICILLNYSGNQIPLRTTNNAAISGIRRKIRDFIMNNNQKIAEKTAKNRNENRKF